MIIDGRICDICEKMYNAGASAGIKISYREGIKKKKLKWFGRKSEWEYADLDVCPSCWTNVVNYCQQNRDNNNEA